MTQKHIRLDMAWIIFSLKLVVNLKRLCVNCYTMCVFAVGVFRCSLSFSVSEMMCSQAVGHSCSVVSSRCNELAWNNGCWGIHLWYCDKTWSHFSRFSTLTQIPINVFFHHATDEVMFGFCFVCEERVHGKTRALVMGPCVTCRPSYPG